MRRVNSSGGHSMKDDEPGKIEDRPEPVQRDPDQLAVGSSDVERPLGGRKGSQDADGLSGTVFETSRWRCQGRRDHASTCLLRPPDAFLSRHASYATGIRFSHRVPGTVVRATSQARAVARGAETRRSNGRGVDTGPTRYCDSGPGREEEDGRSRVARVSIGTPVPSAVRKAEVTPCRRNRSWRLAGRCGDRLIVPPGRVLQPASYDSVSERPWIRPRRKVARPELPIVGQIAVWLKGSDRPGSSNGCVSAMGQSRELRRSSAGEPERRSYR